MYQLHQFNHSPGITTVKGNWYTKNNGRLKKTTCFSIPQRNVPAHISGNDTICCIHTIDLKSVLWFYSRRPSFQYTITAVNRIVFMYPYRWSNPAGWFLSFTSTI